MAQLSESVQRPKGFPFSESEFHKIKRANLSRIISGQLQQYYDEWVLRGMPKEPFHPTAAIGIFPTPAMTPDLYTFEPEVLFIDPNHRQAEEYWTDILTLPFTDRVQTYQDKYFADHKGREDEAFKGFLSVCIQNILPSGLVLFSRPGESSEESAYMVSPRFVPPSATYHHLIDQAMLHKVKRAKQK